MSTTFSSLPRRRHTDLQPLATSHDSANGHEGRASISNSGPLTNTSALPSPSVLAARAYFLETSPPIGHNSNALLRRRSLIGAQEFPRRHSVLPSPGLLETQMASFKVSCPDQDLEVVRETQESGPQVRAVRSEDISMKEVKKNDLLKVTAVATAVRSKTFTVPVPEAFPQVPFQYTHDRLRDWGHAYLGNTTTADAFIHAIDLRRPSLELAKEDGVEDPPQSTGMVTIRARVHPRAKERKPFVIQRQFDIEELRTSIPTTQRPAGRVSSLLRRSNRRSSAQLPPSTSSRRGNLSKAGANLTVLGKGPMPIHIEYALHFLPVLAALMLSGHVRKGDSIDLPVPHPEAWRDMISYVYTGKGKITASVKGNILYLAGNAG